MLAAYCVFGFHPMSGQEWRNLETSQIVENAQVMNLVVVDEKLLINIASTQFEDFEDDYLLYWDSVQFELGPIGFGQLDEDLTINCKQFIRSGDSLFIAGHMSNLIFEDERLIVGYDLINEVPFNMHAGNSNNLDDAVLYHDTLFAMGSFWGTPSGIQGEYELPQLAAWTDNEWHFVGGVLAGGGYIQGTVYDDKLVISGYINAIVQTDWSAQASPNVVYYQNGLWSAFPGNVLGDLIYVDVHPLTGDLYIAGGYISIDGELTSGMVYYDGDNWNKLFDTDPLVLGVAVHIFHFYRGQIYAFGSYSNGTEGVEDFRMMRYDGYNWHDGENFGESWSAIRDMHVYKDELYVCGLNMDTLNGEPLYPENIARFYIAPEDVQWGIPEDTPEIENPVSVLELFEYEMKLFPNPAETEVHLQLQVPFTGAIVVTDARGYQVSYEEVTSCESYTISRGGLSAGLYYLNLVKSGQIVSSERVVFE